MATGPHHTVCAGDSAQVFQALLAATQRSRARLAAPESMDSAATAIFAASCSVSVPGPWVQGDQGRRRVEQHRFPYRAPLAVQQAAGHIGVVRGVGAAQRVDRDDGQPDVARVERLLADRAVAHHPDPGGGGGGQLVEPVVAAEDEGGVAPVGQHARDDGRHPGVGDPDGLGAHLGRVGEGAQDVERGLRAEFLAA